MTLRPETEDDLPFLTALYATTRERELAQVTGWSSEQKAQFLDFQFRAQRTHYRKHYPVAAYDVVERSGDPIGRLYVAALADELRLMDVALVPGERGKGIGERLCRDVMDRARAERRVVSLHVEADNPARRLYARLGFVTVGEVSFYELMHWIPDGLEQVSTALADQLKTAS